MNSPMRKISDRGLVLPLLAILTIAGMMGRLLPHAPNATPTVALGLVAGAVFGSRLGVLLPVAILGLTDLVLGTYSPLVMASVYACLVLPAILGARRLGQNRHPLAIALSALTCSIVFFLVTNFAVWYAGDWYARSPAGLFACYAAAVPFLKNMIAADLIWTGTLFTALAMIEHRRIDIPARIRLRSGN